MNKYVMIITSILSALTLVCDNRQTVGYHPHEMSHDDVIGMWWGMSWDGYRIEEYDSGGRYVNKTYLLRANGSEWIKERDTGIWRYVGKSFDMEIVRHSCWFCEGVMEQDTPFVKGECLHERDTIPFCFFDNWWMRDDWGESKWRKLKDKR